MAQIDTNGFGPKKIMNTIVPGDGNSDFKCQSKPYTKDCVFEGEESTCNWIQTHLKASVNSILHIVAHQRKVETQFYHLVSSSVFTINQLLAVLLISRILRNSYPAQSCHRIRTLTCLQTHRWGHEPSQRGCRGSLQIRPRPGLRVRLPDRPQPWLRHHLGQGVPHLRPEHPLSAGKCSPARLICHPCMLLRI